MITLLALAAPSPAADLPDWLDLGFAHRVRFERLTPADQGLALRTNLTADLRRGPVRLGAELVDSRLYLADPDRLDTSMVDPLEVLQAWGGIEREGLSIRVGRITMDVGSRRLVARNRYRNTINAFTGVDARWTTPGGDELRGFLAMPVRRLPDDPEGLAAARVVYDRERPGDLFGGLSFGSRELPRRLRAEGVLLGRLERDGEGIATRDRRLLTPGVRVRRDPAASELDLEVEGALQVGRSRASSSDADTRDLAHLAGFAHLGVGYTFDVPLAPRLAVVHDTATGDRDPDDDRNGRFDTLFGARRFEYGPTSLWGLFARSNVHSPGLRVEAALPDADAFVSWRAYWLAAARDAWTTTGVRDPSGQSGTFVGHQLEGRVRVRLLEGHVALDAGLAHTWLGGFATTAPNATSTADPTYGYAQVMLGV